MGDVMPRSPHPFPFLRASGENKDNCYSSLYFKHTVLKTHNILKSKQNICAIFSNSVFVGGGLFCVNFFFEARVEETVPGPLIQ